MSTVVSTRYVIQYNSANNNADTFSLASDKPFVVPHVGAIVEANHDGKKVSGVVSKLHFIENTFPDGAGIGLRSHVIVYVQ